MFRRTLCWKQKQNSKNCLVSKFEDFFQSKHYFSTKLTKLLFKRWDEQFDGKLFFEKPFLNLFETLRETLSATKIRKAVKSGSYVFRRPFWWKKKYFESCFFFVIWAIFSLTFVKKYSATLAEGPSKLLDEHFDVQQFLLKKLFFFWILVETFSEFLYSFFEKLWKVFSKNWCEHFNQKNLFWKFLKLFRNGI